MSGYQTEQKKILLSFLEKNSNQAYSIDEIVHGLSTTSKGEAPGKSTVYRLMTRLLEEGCVKRFVKGNSRHFVYQLLQGGHCHMHLHLKCVLCGNLLHLDDATSHRLLQTIAEVQNFTVSEKDTVLFGTCKHCQGDHSHA